MGEITQELLKRLKEPNEFIHDNLKRTPSGQVEQILCWKCGTVVAGYVDNDVVETSIVNGERVHKIRQVFRQLANYAKAHFVLDGGEIYTPVFCTNCVGSINKDDCEKLLVRDAALLHKERGESKDVAFFLKKRVSQFKGRKVGR